MLSDLDFHCFTLPRFSEPPFPAMPENTECTWCKGTGDCQPCEASGRNGVYDCSMCGGSAKCSKCKGSGTVPSKSCLLLSEVISGLTLSSFLTSLSIDLRIKLVNDTIQRGPRRTDILQGLHTPDPFVITTHAWETLLIDRGPNMSSSHVFDHSLT